jgi:single-strand DNA-binding protein
MARSLNEVKLIGNLGNDPDVKTLADDTMVASFSLATSKQWTDKAGEKHEKTEWHRCVAWRNLAKIISEWVQKGNKLYVCGELQTRDYEQDGVKKYTTEIVVNDLIMLGGDAKSSRAAKPQTASQPPYVASDDDDDNLPF